MDSERSSGKDPRELRLGISSAGSLFEAKMGAKAHASPPASGDPVSDRSALPCVKKAAKEARKHLQIAVWGVFSFSDDMIKKIQKKLSPSFDAMCFVKLPLPVGQEWSQTIYRLELFLQGAFLQHQLSSRRCHGGSDGH